MPWKEKNVMELKEEFVIRALSREVSMIDLCREYGISAKTGYKWINRFKEKGFGGLVDLPRRPKSCSTEIGEDIICEMVRLKRAHRKWGPRKIRELYARNYPSYPLPSVSSFHRILEKCGYINHRKRRKKRPGGRVQNRFKPKNPNDLWTVDFKGWWYTTEKQRCEPLTIRDEYSRFILAISVLENAGTKCVQEEFDKIFHIHGLPKVIRSDNGTPFASGSAPLGLSKLSAWWITLGIELDRINPGHPEENGAHERLHKDIRMELEGHICGDLFKHQAAFDLWRKEFNWERPHESLDMKTPGEVYKKSDQKYDREPEEIEYGPGFIVRKVGKYGSIKIMNRSIRITTSLSGYNVGLKFRNDGGYEVWFDYLCLGTIDVKMEKFQTVRGG